MGGFIIVEGAGKKVLADCIMFIAMSKWKRLYF